jgi:hypothetical protein
MRRDCGRARGEGSEGEKSRNRKGGADLDAPRGSHPPRPPKRDPIVLEKWKESEREGMGAARRLIFQIACA